VALLLAVAVSTLLYVLQHWSKALLPDIVLRAIPGRLINMQACFVVPLVVAIAVFVSDEIARRLDHRRARSTQGSFFLRFPNGIAASVLVVLAACLVPVFVSDLVAMHRDPDRVAARQEPEEIDSPFWSEVRALRFNRLVLTAPELSLKALRYGRLPIVLDTTAIDFVPYLPQTATALGMVVERGYGVSFFHPPAIFKFGARLTAGTGQDYWACLSPAQWQGIGRDFGIAALLAPADWTVHLPLLLSDTDYALYAVPDGTSAGESDEPSCPLQRD
jgi:hypothetical protein